MNKTLLAALALVVAGLTFGAYAYAIDYGIVSGRILLSVEERGEAWYVDPVELNRYYLRDGDAAYTALRTYGLGITNENLSKIPVGLNDNFVYRDSDSDGLYDTLEVGLGTDPLHPDSDRDGYTDRDEVESSYNPLGSGTMAFDYGLVRTLHGRILLQVERNGEAWYVNPEDGKRYYMPTGQAAYDIMRFLGLGITVSDLAQIPKASTSAVPPGGGEIGEDQNSSYALQEIITASGTFQAHVIRLRRDSFSMVTAVAQGGECEGNCAAQPLADYVSQSSALAGINGTYFCPPDYGECAGKTYTFYPPVYDTSTDQLVRGGNLMSFHNRPMIAQTGDGGLHYFHRDEDFGTSLVEFESRMGSQVTGVIGSWPSLIENGQNVLAGEPQEPGFSALGRRGGIGWDSEHVYLVNIGGATVANLADVFGALGTDYAMNLDGGGSSAMYYGGEYKLGPGRLLPNAVVFRAVGE